MIVPYILGIIVIIIGFGAFFGAPYVPSRRRDLKRMFDELYLLNADDVVADIGSGDGLVLREVRRQGAQAVGYEINPVLAFISRLLSFGDKGVRIHLANFWLAALPKDVTLVYIFSVSRDGRKLKQKMQVEADALGKPLLLVCYGSPLPGIQAVKTFEAYHLYRFSPLQSPQP